MDNFAVFIISHGRPEEQLTYNTLMRCGYSGRFYIVLDDTDITIQKYIDIFGADNILIFNKNHYINADEFDNGVNYGIYSCAVYARRAVEDIAKLLNLKYFCLMDDDITDFCIRYYDGKMRRYKISNFNRIFEIYIELLENENFSCIGFGRPNLYFIPECFIAETRYVPFQVFIRKVSEPVKWACWYGEDEISGYEQNTTGKLWFVIPFVMTSIAPISTGAMSDVYKQYNSYERSITELRYRPADFIIDVSVRGNSKGLYRLYRKNMAWFPKIISSKYKKI